MPGKNMRVFAGKPLIWYTFEVAKRAKFISEVILSTDDPIIAKFGKENGVQVPFLRPRVLAKDNSSSADALFYTIERIKRERRQEIPVVVLLQPTSPLRLSSDIDQAVQIFFKKDADQVMSVCKMNHSSLWTKRIDNAGLLSDFYPKVSGRTGSGVALRTYIPNGAVYVYATHTLKLKEDALPKRQLRVRPYIMPKERSIDIDDQYDFWLAEKIFTKNRK